MNVLLWGNTSWRWMCDHSWFLQPSSDSQGMQLRVTFVLAETEGADPISGKINITLRTVEQGDLCDFQLMFLLYLHHNFHQCSQNRTLFKLISEHITKIPPAECSYSCSIFIQKQLLMVNYYNYIFQLYQYLHSQKQTIRVEESIGQYFVLFKTFGTVY